MAQRESEKWRVNFSFNRDEMGFKGAKSHIKRARLYGWLDDGWEKMRRLKANINLSYCIIKSGAKTQEDAGNGKQVQQQWIMIGKRMREWEAMGTHVKCRGWVNGERIKYSNFHSDTVLSVSLLNFLVAFFCLWCGNLGKF